MADDLSKTGPRDSTKINPDQDYEVQYWSEKFGVSKEELKRAVQSAGPMVEDVRRHLNR